MEFIKSTAHFSDCGKYRFHLSRVWDESKPSVCWCLLNPSTADAEKLDPTLTRCLNYSLDWGYGQMHVINAFAFRATDPTDMMAAEDPVGENVLTGGIPVSNDGYMTLIPGICQMTVVGWGVGGEFKGRYRAIASLAKARNLQLKCLGRTKSGHPRHPLYLPRNAKLEEWP
jgi:hypothetical protein